MSRRGVAIGMIAAFSGVGLGVLAAVVSAAAPPGCSSSTVAGRVTVECGAGGTGTVTVPGGTPVTVEVAGGQGGSSQGGISGANGAHFTSMWTPTADTVLRVAPGLLGSTGDMADPGGRGGGATLVHEAQDAPSHTYFLAGGGGGGGKTPGLGAGGAGGDPNGGAGGGGAGGATGATPGVPVGAGGMGGTSASGTIGPGGAGVNNGGWGGDGFAGGAGGDADGGGGGSSFSDTAATYDTAGNPGNGYARFSWAAPAAGAVQITSPDTAAFTAGQPGSFTISANGTPTPSVSLDGGLPGGLSFTSNGDGTGTISGVPPAGYGGTSTVTVTARNGAQADATQQLRISVTVPQAPETPADPPVLPPQVITPTPAPVIPPDPQLVPVADESIVVVPISGTVIIRRPDGTLDQLAAGEEIPVGSVIDARNGVVQLTAARDANGVRQTALFWNAIFKVTQLADPDATTKSTRQLMTRLTLRQQPTGCRTKRSKDRARAAGLKRPGLWGDGHGRFQVRGDASAATVRGTRWYVENRCGGTYTRVVRGIVAVEDFATHKTTVLRAGGTYTAKRRGG
jgi:hypothetical protein